MSERWKPKHGEIYYFVDSLFTVGSYAWRDVGTDAQYHKCGNCFRTEEEARAAAEKVKSLLLSLHYNGTSTANSETLKGTFTEHLKKFAEHHADVILQKARERRLSEQYNNAPEETKLPEWCKQGEWIYTSSEQYLKINGISIDLQKIELSNGATWSKQDIIDEAVPARLRPYNAAEMKALVGKVLTCNARSTPFSFLVVYAEGDGSFIESYRFKYTAKVLKDHFTINGKPCGVLEHLNENREWVE